MKMSFIEKLSIYAVTLGRKNNVLPSVIIAQGVLESASGTSELAVKANNLFGIKKGSDWKGETYLKRTAEQRPDGTVFYIEAEFRKYPSYEGCVIDLCYKYNHGTGWEKFNRYESILGQKDYAKVTESIFKAGYATDVKYPQKLNDVIKKYKLTEYDKEEVKMVKVAIDAGHGIDTAGKRTPDGEREWTFNNKVLLACQKRLLEYDNIEILRLDDPTGKVDIPLATRTNKANNWKADVLVSIHHNADKGKWGSHGGVETYTQIGASKASSDIAKAIQPKIVSAMGLRDRGVKTNDLHMTRESKMPAVLTEGGFMDSTTDISSLRNDLKLKNQGIAIADGLAVYFKLKLKVVAPTPPTPPVTKPEVGDKVNKDIFVPDNNSIANSTSTLLKRLEGKENGIDAKWRESFLKGELTQNQLLGILVVALERGLFESLSK